MKYTFIIITLFIILSLISQTLVSQNTEVSQNSAITKEELESLIQNFLQYQESMLPLSLQANFQSAKYYYEENSIELQKSEVQYGSIDFIFENINLCKSTISYSISQELKDYLPTILVSDDQINFQVIETENSIYRQNTKSPIDRGGVYEIGKKEPGPTFEPNPYKLYLMIKQIYQSINEISKWDNFIKNISGDNITYTVYSSETKRFSLFTSKKPFMSLSFKFNNGDVNITPHTIELGLLGSNDMGDKTIFEIMNVELNETELGYSNFKYRRFKPARSLGNMMISYSLEVQNVKCRIGIKTMPEDFRFLLSEGSEYSELDLQNNIQTKVILDEETVIDTN